MIWQQIKYAQMLGSSLRNFKAKGRTTFNFSCPFCGDSKTDKTKARAYFFKGVCKETNSDALFFKCHNCTEVGPFGYILHKLNKTLHGEFTIECLKESGTFKPKKISLEERIKAEPRFVFDVKDTSVLTNCTELDSSHKAMKYLESRQLIQFKEHFFWTDDYKEAMYKQCPQLEIEDIRIKSDERLCLPLKRADGTLFGYIGRSLDPDAKSRYITIKFDPAAPKVFGLDRFDKSKPSFLLEGAIDSLFLPNALGMCGGTLSFDMINSIMDKEHTYICLDNEPRKRETVTKLLKFADAGYKVVVWKNINTRLNDINDMIVKGNMSRRDILNQIASCSFSGIRASFEIEQWKKV